MSGFFYLGGRQEEKPQKDETLYLYRNNNEDSQIYNKHTGFEIWPQQFYPQQSSHQSAFGAGPSSRRSNNFTISNDSRSSSLMSEGSRAHSGMNCQDCGNQAKKDCPHMRCRTCCKSRGLPCQTHVKSTWVPAAKRRERQQLSTLQQQEQEDHHHQQLQLQPKRLRDGAGTSAVCTRLTTTISGLELGNFPPEVNSPAVFRCVKVSGMDDEDEEYAYQTAVNIGGHMFKGILYDQGRESSSSGGGGGAERSRSDQQLNLITASTAATTTAAAAASSSNPPGSSGFDPAIYPSTFNAFLSGTPFFPPPRSM